MVNYLFLNKIKPVAEKAILKIAIIPRPQGLSIIQDPNHMNSIASSSNQAQRRSVRSLRPTNIEDQKRVEN